MNGIVNKCIDCGSSAIHTITDSIKTIFRMEQMYFRCGAIRTSSCVDRWQASKVSYEGCLAIEQVYSPDNTDLNQQGIFVRSKSPHRHNHTSNSIY